MNETEIEREALEAARILLSRIVDVLPQRALPIVHRALAAAWLEGRGVEAARGRDALLDDLAALRRGEHS